MRTGERMRKIYAAFVNRDNMNKQHFIAFAEKARQLRVDAKAHEKKGNTRLADCAVYQALGIEQAVIEVGQRFNPRFDVARFRQACNPDLPNSP